MIVVGIYIKGSKEAGETSAARCKDIQVEERKEKSSNNKAPHSKSQPSWCGLIFWDAELGLTGAQDHWKSSKHLIPVHYPTHRIASHSFQLQTNYWKLSHCFWPQTIIIYHRCGLCEIHQKVTWLQSKSTSSICGTLKWRRNSALKKHLVSTILWWDCFVLFCF